MDDDTLFDRVIHLVRARQALTQDRIASLERDVESYRLLAQQAIHALHRLTRQNDRLREQHRRLLEECRSLRAHLIDPSTRVA